MADNDDSVIELSASSSKALTHRKTKPGGPAKSSVSPSVRDLIRFKLSQNNQDNVLMDHLKSDLKTLRSSVTLLMFMVRNEEPTQDMSYMPWGNQASARSGIPHIVHLVVSRAELLPVGETLADHIRLRQEESQHVDRDKANKSETSGGLFRGWFQRTHPTVRALRDAEDGVDRCPVCHWELEGARCFRCEARFDPDGRMILGDGPSSWTGSSLSEDDLDDELDMEDDLGLDAFPTSPTDDYTGFYPDSGPAAHSSASPSFSPPNHSASRTTAGRATASRARSGRLTRSQRGLTDDLDSLTESSGNSNSDTIDEQDGDEEEDGEGSEDDDDDLGSLRDFIDDDDHTVQPSVPLWETELESEEERLEPNRISSRERRRRETRQALARNPEGGIRAAANFLPDSGTDDLFRPQHRPSALRHVENAYSDPEENETDGLDAVGPSDTTVTNRRKRSRTESTSTTDDLSSTTPSRPAARIRTRAGDGSRTTRQGPSAIRSSNRAANSPIFISSTPGNADGDLSMSDSPDGRIPGRRTAFSAFASRPGRRIRANRGTSQANAINLDGDSSVEASTQASRRRSREILSRRLALPLQRPAPTARQPSRRAPSLHSFTEPETSDDEAGTLTGNSYGTTTEGSNEEPSESESLSPVLPPRRSTRSGSRHQPAQAESSRTLPARNRREIQLSP
ncbi:MAG: hypothetical protein M1816_005782 [Peltula sp. TS41687]|nr:MAG: hypothetical protein M1816_005782 [Peltula sp. TS41687]